MKKDMRKFNFLPLKNVLRLLAVAALPLVFAQSALSAPGVPVDPVLVFLEDFENLPAATATTLSTGIQNYNGTGLGSTTGYDASPYWQKGGVGDQPAPTGATLNSM